MKSLSQLVRAFGVSVPRVPNRAAIQELLATVKGADCSFAVNLAVLRSFEKAQYSPLHIGHFALASIHYCHFTSPIRRYADLLVHRVLEFYLQNRTDLAKGISAGQDLTEIGKHLTFTEQRADDAENELKTVLILQMLSKRTGEELDCVVTGLTNFGVFVQSRKFGIEGLITMGDLGGDVWKYNQKAQCVTGMRSGANIHLGKAIKVRIVSVNVPARQLNLVPVKPLAAPTVEREKDRRAKKSRKAKHIEKRR
jgi:ribonuclease R